MICNSSLSNNIVLLCFTDRTSTKTHVSQCILPTTNKNKTTKKISELQPSTICLRSKTTDTRTTRHSARLANAAKFATVKQMDKKHTGNIPLVIIFFKYIRKTRTLYIYTTPAVTVNMTLIVYLTHFPYVWFQTHLLSYSLKTT